MLQQHRGHPPQAPVGLPYAYCWPRNLRFYNTYQNLQQLALMSAPRFSQQTRQKPLLGRACAWQLEWISMPFHFFHACS